MVFVLMTVALFCVGLCWSNDMFYTIPPHHTTTLETTRGNLSSAEAFGRQLSIISKYSIRTLVLEIGKVIISSLGSAWMLLLPATILYLICLH